MKLLIVRHGDPDYSIDSLTETGWKEAELLSRRLRKLNVKNFYVSPLGRARDTALPTLKATGAEAEVCQWLREFNVSIQRPDVAEPGCAWGWLPADWTAEPKFYDRSHWMDVEQFRAANTQAEWQWVTTSFDALLAQHGYVRQGDLYRAETPNEDTIVFFCHFGVECVLLGHLLGISPMILWHCISASPTSVTTLVTEERRAGIAQFRMLAFGDTAHLYAADEEPSFAGRYCETYANQSQWHG